MGGLARLHDLSGDLVGVDELGPRATQQVRDRRLPRSDAPGQTDGQHQPEASPCGRPGRQGTACDREQHQRRVVGGVGDEPIVLGDPGRPTRILPGHQAVGDGEESRVGGHVPGAGDAVPEIEDVEGQHLVGLGPAGREFGLDGIPGVDPADPDLGEVPLEQCDELVTIEQVEMEGVLEVRRLVGGEEVGGSPRATGSGRAPRRGPRGRRSARSGARSRRRQRIPPASPARRRPCRPPGGPGGRKRAGPASPPSGCSRPPPPPGRGRRAAPTRSPRRNPRRAGAPGPDARRRPGSRVVQGEEGVGGHPLARPLPGQALVGVTEGGHGYLHSGHAASEHAGPAPGCRPYIRNGCLHYRANQAGRIYGGPGRRSLKRQAVPRHARAWRHHDHDDHTTCCRARGRPAQQGPAPGRDPAPTSPGPGPDDPAGHTRPGRLRPAPRGAARRGHGRHQDVPLPGPRQVPAPGLLDVEPRRRPSGP